MAEEDITCRAEVLDLLLGKIGKGMVYKRSNLAFFTGISKLESNIAEGCAPSNLFDEVSVDEACKKADVACFQMFQHRERTSLPCSY